MVKIISDSTCDLSPDLLQKYDIDILPLHILLGEKEYRDGRDITPDEIFALVCPHPGMLCGWQQKSWRPPIL